MLRAGFGGADGKHAGDGRDLADVRDDQKQRGVAADRGHNGLRVIKPKSIRIKATDLNGKVYDFEIPWT
jgi:hypothetical protein